MQLFVVCGSPSRSIVVEVSSCDNFLDVKHRLSGLCSCSTDDMLLIHGGRICEDEREVRTSQLQHGSMIHLTSRLRGGGGDGGSTGAESRSCYLEMYMGKRHMKVNPAEELLAKWTRCHLSNELLTPPCVIDELGSVYNKDSLINAMLHKSLPPGMKHISSLKHVVDMKLQRNKACSETKASDQRSFQPSNDSPFCCPVSGVAFNGRFKFSVHRKTGHVVSEKAMKDVPSVVEELIGEKLTGAEFIPVNPPQEVLESLYDMVASRMAAEREKKSKKRAKAEAPAGDDPSSSNTCAPSTSKLSTAAAAGSELPKSCAVEASVNGGVNGGVKKAKTSLAVPVGATKEVYASLFNKPGQSNQKETYCCRNTSGRGFNLT